jgi:hypothetical protein
MLSDSDSSGLIGFDRWEFPTILFIAASAPNAELPSILFERLRCSERQFVIGRSWRFPPARFCSTLQVSNG